MLRSNEAERRYDSDRGLEDDSGGALRTTVAASLRTAAAEDEVDGGRGLGEYRRRCLGLRC
jgi:hypothetical protein